MRSRDQFSYCSVLRSSYFQFLTNAWQREEAKLRRLTISNYDQFAVVELVCSCHFLFWPAVGSAGYNEGLCIHESGQCTKLLIYSAP